MRSKKCLIVGVTLAACLFGLHTGLWGQELKDTDEEVKILQEKIKQLENVVETQQRTISQLNQKLNEQTKENERLKELYSKAGIDVSSLTDIQLSKVESQNLSKASVNELYQFYNKPITDLQKEEQYKSDYRGKWVQWTGKVISVRAERAKKDGPEHYFVEFIHGHPDQDKAKDKVVTRVKVEFDRALKQRLLSLDKGSTVTYQGKLPDSYTGLASLCDMGVGEQGGIRSSGHLTLTNGRLVSALDKRGVRKIGGL